jgi:hypothetical protein
VCSLVEALCAPFGVSRAGRCRTLPRRDQRYDAAKCATAAAVFAAFLVGCGRPQTAEVRFESEPRTIAASAVGAPSFAFGSGGDLQLLVATASGDKTHLHAFMSRDGGDTFNDLGLVSRPSSDVTQVGETHPRLVMDRNEFLYAVWREHDPNARIVVASHDWRHPGFTRPVEVRDIDSSTYSGFPDMAVAPNGNIYVVWLDGRDYDQNIGDVSSVYFARSTDGGKSFGRNIRIAAHTCSCCRPTIAVDSKGRIYVAWRHNFDDVRDMAVATSVDRGRTFTPLVRVARDGWRIHGCPESGPSLLPIGDRLYIAWFTLGADSRPRVLASWSDDHSHSFVTPVELSAGLLDANHPMLFAGKPNGVWVAFQARSPRIDSGWSPFQIYVTRIDPSATPAVAVTDSSVDEEYPFAVMRDAQSLFIGVSSAGHAAVSRARVGR